MALFAHGQQAPIGGCGGGDEQIVENFKKVTKCQFLKKHLIIFELQF